ncbi:hypothetical protein [Rhizobium sp. IMFF44]|uniref:hypothetical protein n=1 Tax=Rhizobium sp. IMFF44 TaxID=3342350 RepID=UPI0035BB8DE5
MQLVEFSLMETILGEGERKTHVNPENIVNIVPNQDDEDGNTTKVNLKDGKYIIVNGTYEEIRSAIDAAMEA